MRELIDRLQAENRELKSDLDSLSALCTALEKNMEDNSREKLKMQIKITILLSERNQYLDESNKYLQALRFMAAQLTNPDNPPSIKIALALEEYIGAVQTVKKG